VNPGNSRSRLITGVITLVLGVGVTIGVMAGVIGPQLFHGGGHPVYAVFANTQQLLKGDEVHISGVNEGTVNSIKLNPGGRSSTVGMTIDNGAGPLYRNASAVLQWKTLLGGAFFIALNRGTPTAGPLRSHVIPESSTGNQVELDDVLSVENAGAERGLKTMLPQLATALSKSAPPANALGTLATVAPTVATGVSSLRGVDQDYDLQHLVTAASHTLAALNAPDNEVRGAVQGAAATLAVTAARAGDIETTLDDAPAAMNQTDTTFRQLDTTLGIADPLLDKVDTVASAVAPTFADLHPTAVGADRLLHTAKPLLQSLSPAMSSIASTALKGLPLIKALTPSLDSLQSDVLPYLNANDPATDHTTAEMIGPTLEALGPDIAGQEDQNGHFIRFPATAGSVPVYAACQVYLADPDAKQLLACETLQQALDSFLNYNPLTSVEGGTPSGPAGGVAPTPSLQVQETTTTSHFPTTTTTSNAGTGVAKALQSLGETLSKLLGGKR
jgi:ABC-type transporter Mla subunit MlaD